ncbi:hypothetical protein T492DRAFT_603170, partial [Pavlovales sp. CCMP2436]
WAVRCAIPIPAGSFVAEYHGLVITDKEAEELRNKEVEDPDMYLFELDGEAMASGDTERKKENMLCVDARDVGNVGRFFNHSCEPNLFIQNVHVAQTIPPIPLPPRWPVLCLFALRRIDAGEELTYDYGYLLKKLKNES